MEVEAARSGLVAVVVHSAVAEVVGGAPAPLAAAGPPARDSPLATEQCGRKGDLSISASK